MKKMITSTMVAGAALALVACGPDKAEAPVETTTTEEVTPAPEATEVDPAVEAAVDPTGNPISPAAE